MESGLNQLHFAWQDPVARKWFPIGRLSREGDHYVFAYTKGAEQAREQCGFEPLKSFPDLDEVYESSDLFAVFANRLPARSRSDYKEFAEWINIPEDVEDPIAILARTGGRRKTDSFEVFPHPIPDDEGCCHIHFFAHGLRHFPPESAKRVSNLAEGESLLLMHDFENPHDCHALMLRTNDTFERDRYPVGYCPRYLVEDIVHLSSDCLELPEVAVERVNPPPCPLQFRLMCNMTACWPGDWKPLSTEHYHLIRADAEIPSARQ